MLCDKCILEDFYGIYLIYSLYGLWEISLFIPILWLGKLRYREVKNINWDHSASNLSDLEIYIQVYAGSRCALLNHYTVCCYTISIERERGSELRRGEWERKKDDSVIFLCSTHYITDLLRARKYLVCLPNINTYQKTWVKADWIKQFWMIQGYKGVPEIKLLQRGQLINRSLRKCLLVFWEN